MGSGFWFGLLFLVLHLALCGALWLLARSRALEVEGSLNGKKVTLFGSYGWGDGQWMRDWCERAKEDGAVLFSEEGLICNETPDDDAQAACRKLGADLAAW